MYWGDNMIKITITVEEGNTKWTTTGELSSKMVEDLKFSDKVEKLKKTIAQICKKNLLEYQSFPANR
jgi:2',3'-cyclic-nucleotide 2'-phosphodiesterase (5'-nucleotidase family)